MDVRLEETITLDFVTHRFDTGAVTDDDATPTVEVFEDSTDTTLAGITVTKRTAKTGNYRAVIVCTAANGYEAGKSYNAVATATVNSVVGKGAIGAWIMRSAVNLGLTALPAAAADAAGGLPISDAGGLDMDAQKADIVSILADTGTDGVVLPQAQADKVWSSAGRTLTSFGTLIADIWASATRTLTAAADSSGITTLLSRIIGTLAAGTHVAQSADHSAAIADLPTVAEFTARSVPTDAGAGAAFTAAGLANAPSGGLDAAGVRSAVGLASANLDTQLADLPTVAEFTARTAPTTAGAGAEFTAAALVNAPGGGTGLTAQQTRDAMLLAPTPLATEEDDSIDHQLAVIASDAFDSTIMLGGVATAAAVEKIPKSDGSLVFNPTLTAALRSVVDAAIAAYDASHGGDAVHGGTVTFGTLVGEAFAAGPRTATPVRDIFTNVRLALNDENANLYKDPKMVNFYNRAIQEIWSLLIAFGAEVITNAGTIVSDGGGTDFQLPTDFRAFVPDSLMPRSPITATADYSHVQPLGHVGIHDSVMKCAPTATATPRFFAIFKSGQSQYIRFAAKPASGERFDFLYYPEVQPVTVSTVIAGTATTPWLGLCDPLIARILEEFCREGLEFVTTKREQWRARAAADLVQLITLRHVFEHRHNPSALRGLPR